MSDIEGFKKNLFNFCVGHNDQSIVIESPAEMCFYCGQTEGNLITWFEYKSPPFCKDVMLYTVDKIG